MGPKNAKFYDDSKSEEKFENKAQNMLFYATAMYITHLTKQGSFSKL